LTHAPVAPSGMRERSVKLHYTQADRRLIAAIKCIATSMKIKIVRDLVSFLPWVQKFSFSTEWEN